MFLMFSNVSNSHDIVTLEKVYYTREFYLMIGDS